MAAGANVSGQPSVVYVLPDKMGGSATIVANLLKYRGPDEFTYRAVLTHNRLDTDTPLRRDLGADSQSTFEYALPLENIYAVARRLRRAVGSGPGVLVCNDFVEMLLVTLIDPRRTVVQILHGDYDYYYDLASVHEPLVHAFVTYSRVVHDRLLERLPYRRDTIFWLPYGIPLPETVRTASKTPELRLIFVGRLDEAKGVFLLPEIDRMLRERSVNVAWTVVGSGPAGAELHAAWRDSAHVRFVDSATPAEVVRLCAEHDVFVLPTRAEGLSVATVEAMGAGVVPVVTDLPGMVELVGGDRPGYRVDRNPEAFVDAITGLARDRERLETMSAAARRLVAERFDIRERAAAYQALFARWRDLYRPRPALPVTSYGSRLDQRWLPNPVVRLVRTALRAAR